MFRLGQLANDPRLPDLLSMLLDALPDMVKSAKSAQNIERLLAYTYGKAHPDVDGYNPNGEVFIGQLTTDLTDVNEAEDNGAVMDFSSVLGKPASVGYIANIGSEPCNIYYVRLDVTNEKPTRRGPEYLPSGAATDVLGFTSKIYVLSDNGNAVRVQAKVR